MAARPAEAARRAVPGHWEGDLVVGDDMSSCQYFPKGTDFSKVADGEVREVQNLLNSRPRKSLGFMTPPEVLNEMLLDCAMIL